MVEKAQNYSVELGKIVSSEKDIYRTVPLNKIQRPEKQLSIFL